MIFFFNDTATTEIYTLSLHDALPISLHRRQPRPAGRRHARADGVRAADRRPVRQPAAQRDDLGAPAGRGRTAARSEEHTSELQSRQYLVCRLLLEKKNHQYHYIPLLP